MLEVRLPPGSLLAPVHTHLTQDEASYVLEGELCFYSTAMIRRRRAGDFNFKPKGVPHDDLQRRRRAGALPRVLLPAGLDEYLEEGWPRCSRRRGPPDLKRIGEIADKYQIQPDFSTIAELGEALRASASWN